MSQLQPASPPRFPASESNQPASPKGSKRGAKGRFRFSKVFTRWWWLSVLLVIGVTYTVSQIPVWMDMRGPLYESTALVEVKPIVDVDPTVSTSGGGMGASMTRQFMNTQFEIIIAPATLELALAKNDLLNRLGGDKAAAMARFKKSTRTSQRRGTDLIDISYRDEDALLARDVATALYEAYKERRYDLEMGKRKDRLKAMKVELQYKKDRVAELRKRLMDVAEKSGLIYVETEEGGKMIDDVSKPRKGSDSGRRKNQPNVACKEYETARAIKDGMEARYDLERTKLVMPTNSVIVHQIPEQGRVPVTRGRNFVAALASVLSLPISIGLGILLMYIAEAILPRKA